jgi:hypothetical protein
MTFKKLGFSVLITALFCIPGIVVFGELTNLTVEVCAKGKFSNGKYFAFVRGHGLVQEGDILIVSNAELSCKIQVLSINSTGLKTRTYDVVKKEMQPLPKKIDVPDKDDQFRDPFCPVGYRPQSG